MTERTPNPMGCRLCGIDQLGHAIQAAADGSHTWQQPTQQQIKDRMTARRQQLTQELPSVQQQTTDQMRAQRERLTEQLYSTDPTYQADAYLTLQAIEYGEGQPPECGWIPSDATTECDWDPNCPVHGESSRGNTHPARCQDG
jgi:hypothetical protein